MKNEIKEIYLSSLYWTKTHDNMGGVMADCVFKNNMSYKEFKKLRNKKYFVLCDKDYITNLQEEKKQLKDGWQQEVYDKNEILNRWYETQSRIDKAIEYIETHQLNFKKGITTFGSERLSMEERKLLDILRGYDK